MIAAHVDWNHAPGVFFHLRDLDRGDEVAVDRADGSTARFVVLAVERYPKDAFPTERVYGDIDHAGLRLITCGGSFDRAARSYRDNLVVYAGLVGSTAADRRVGRRELHRSSFCRRIVDHARRSPDLPARSPGSSIELVPGDPRASPPPSRTSAFCLRGRCGTARRRRATPRPSTVGARPSPGNGQAIHPWAATAARATHAA